MLLDNLEGEALDDPRQLRSTTGRREQFWSHNCVAIGLSSGFLEPLESTSIHLIQSNVSRLIELFPREKIRNADREEYNQRTINEFEQIRDFLILHYHQTQRADTEFWRYCKHMQAPDSLTHKIALFRSSGRIGRDVDDLFRDASWAQVMLGQGVTPEDYNPMVDKLDPSQWRAFMADLRKIIESAVAKLPTQDSYIEENCAAAR